MSRKIKTPYIYLRKDGRYEGRYKKYISSDKKKVKMVSVYGATYEEALGKVLREQKPYSKPLLIKELMERWLLEIKETMKPSSYALYQSYALKYLLPEIGDRYANTFDESSFIAVLESIQIKKEKPLARNTIYIMEEIIRAMFCYGAKEKLIPEIYFGKVKYKVQNKKDITPLSELEIQRLIYVIEQQDIETQVFVMLPLYAGISLSELCGLQWKDINLKEGKIDIHRGVKRIQKEIKTEAVSENTATIIQEYELSKNECREFIIPERLKKLLFLAKKETSKQTSYVVGYKRYHRKCSDDADNERIEKIIPADGRTLQYQLKIIGKQAGIYNLNFRMLRDTFAVLCLQAGGDIYSIAYVLGLTVVAACDRYSYWLVKKDEFLKKMG